MSKYPHNNGVKRLNDRFDPEVVSETLPTDVHVAYSDNKGEKLGFCLHKTRSTQSRMIDPDTLFFVALHELSHIMTVEEGHPQIFWENFKFLLQQAEEMDLYRPHNYKRKPVEYCGMTLTDNPYFDL
jgi:predicted metal-dependent hydrolase